MSRIDDTLITLCRGRMELAAADLSSRVEIVVPPKRVPLWAQPEELQAQSSRTDDVFPKPIADQGLEAHAGGRMAGYGERVRWIRAGTALSQAGLARKIRVSVRTIRAWENEERRPHRSTLELLAKLIDVPLDELYAFINSPRKLTTLPKQMRRWIEIPRVSGTTTLAELSKLAEGT